MTLNEGERRLAAIMYTDIVGYTALTQRNEADTMRLLEEHRALIRPLFMSHRGREIKTIGDAFLVEFQSALDAVLCAVAIQQTMHDRKLATGDAPSLRVGVHVGDVIERGNDVLGDAVNIASRIEPLAEPGGVCISDEVYKQVRNKTDLPFVSLGEKQLRNVSIPVMVYSVRMQREQSVAVEMPTFPSNRIAILPFVSMSTSPDDAFFADGMTEEIISTVSGISGLKVISRTSVMRYKKTEKSVEEIGRELKVGSVLEGSFRKAGNRIRVTTQLINVADDEHLWAQNYDRSLDDVFEVQSDVAKQVADALRVRILSNEAERVEKRPTKNTEAYTSYLKGIYLYGKRAGESPIEAVREAVDCFEQAVKEDPEFALGYVGLASCSVKLAEFGVEIGANLERAREMSAKALRLDPGLAEAHGSNGWALMYDRDFNGAEDEFKRAIQLKPGYPQSHNGYHAILLFQHKWDEALEHIETAVELDPLSPVFCFNHGAVYYYRGDYRRGLELCRRSVELGGVDYMYFVAILHGKLKMFEDMRREFGAWVELRKGSLPLAEKIAAIQMARLDDDKGAVKRLLPELESHVQEGGIIGALDIASTYFFLGENDKGFEWLERSYSGREIGFPWITVQPDFDSIRTDPRYLDLLKRLGLD
jgi:TolB-like protein